jgi:hypothetical protein
MERALTDALRDAPPSPRDRAGVQLARRYAQLLDAARGEAGEAATYNELGPKLLACLTALGLTLAGRGAKGGTGDAPAVGGRLDELRARRERRTG